MGGTTLVHNEVTGTVHGTLIQAGDLGDIVLTTGSGPEADGTTLRLSGMVVGGIPGQGKGNALRLMEHLLQDGGADQAAA